MNQTNQNDLSRRDNRNPKVTKLVGTALLSAVVAVLQILGSFIRFGPFSISLVLVPIVIGAVLYGIWSGAWLGFIFGMAVLLSGDAGLFLAVNPAGTVVTVLLKGILAGLGAGLVFQALGKKNTYVSVGLSAVVCPIINTGIFLLCCRLFFFETIKEWAAAAGFEEVGVYMIVGLVGFNFLFELLVNMVLSPLIIRLMNIIKKTHE